MTLIVLALYKVMAMRKENEGLRLSGLMKVLVRDQLMYFIVCVYPSCSGYICYIDVLLLSF